MMNTGIKSKLRAAAAALCMLVILPLCLSVLPGCTGDGKDAGTSSTPATETGAGEEVNNHTEIMRFVPSIIFRYLFGPFFLIFVSNLQIT